jgi:ribosomal protein S18 acetylase RimI-like enzyme
MLHIRPATADDFSSLLACDPYAHAHAPRRTFLREKTAAGAVLLALRDGAAQGFVVKEPGFFGHEFISLVAVSAKARRNGVALALLQAAHGRCATAKLFTSTNTSNRAAQALFARAGFAPSGCVENLDPGDPELIFFKPAGPARRT